MKKTILALAIALCAMLAAPAARAQSDGKELLPTGQAIETGTPVLTVDYPTQRLSGWCQAGVTCVGTLSMEANTCSTCPWKVMASFTPTVPDANGLVNEVYLAPRMYSWRCRIASDYSAGIFHCNALYLK